MDERCARARALIAAALEGIDAELASPRHGLRPEQLGSAREVLRGYLDALERGALPARRDRGEGLGRMVLDAWPYDLPLAALVLQAERAWRNA